MFLDSDLIFSTFKSWFKFFFCFFSISDPISFRFQSFGPYLVWGLGINLKEHWIVSDTLIKKAKNCLINTRKEQEIQIKLNNA